MTSKSLFFIVYLYFLTKTVHLETFEGYIVGGREISIEEAPHSVFIPISCMKREGYRGHWNCGGVILTSRYIFTAGHCFYNCADKSLSFIGVLVGETDKEKELTTHAKDYLLHSEYDPHRFDNDVGMILTAKALKFGWNVKKVAIYDDRPGRTEIAKVSGWGLADERLNIRSQFLKQARQIVLLDEDCLRMYTSLPRGTFCARQPGDNIEYPAHGDSGSGLTIKDFDLIGLVSYKNPSLAATVVYTDAGYFYNWVKYAVDKLSPNLLSECK